LVRGEDREVKSHELDDRPKASHGCANSESGEAELSDRRVDNSFGTEVVKQSFGDFVGAVVFGDFLAH
jgi:hypothetical protein